jgi:DNA-binding response OmpR family regulator
MRVLLIEDNELVVELVRTGFENAGWQVDTGFDCANSVRLLAKHRYDAVVLDIELPDGDGFAILGQIRSGQAYLPVIMLTARSGPDAVVKGLAAGADDYVAKPFDVGELIARVLAVLRRTNTGAQEILEFGDISFNRLTREMTCAGRRVRLTPKEQTFIEQLLLNPGECVSREELLSKVWRMNFDPGSNLIDAHVARLRHKLKNATSNVAIVTRRAAGFAVESTSRNSSVAAS